MKKRSMLLAAVLAASLSYARGQHDAHSGVHRHKTDAEKKGHNLYAAHCSGCHGEYGSGTGPLAYSKEAEEYVGVYKKHNPWPLGCPATSKISDARIKEAVMKGVYCPEHGFVMPPFQLTDEQIRLITREIRSLNHSHD